MKLVVGLGNPGNEYIGTRHNVGFDVVLSSMSDQASGPVSKFQGNLYDDCIGGKKVITLLPQTFMNLSGKSVRSVISFYKIDVGNILVVYDDFDINVGKLRLRQSGSAGTHNGMKSIVQELGTTMFWRLRIGIGPKDSTRSVSDFVLSKFTNTQSAEINSVFPMAREVISEWINEDYNHAFRLCSL